MSKANEVQVGGSHYHANGKQIQHWDIVAMHDLDYFQGQITKYVMRWKMKNGLQDLQKAAHFLQKYIELNTLQSVDPPSSQAAGVVLDDTIRSSGGYLSDQYFQAEGGWGDGQILYTCITCRTSVKARSLGEAYQQHAQPCPLPRR